MTLNVSQSFQLPCGVTIKNRFFKSAMSEALSKKNNKPTTKHNALYEQWALGGSAIVVTGNVMVDRRALGEPGNVVLDALSDLSKFKDWAKAGTQNNTQIFMQLNHPGKQSPRSMSKHPVAPSAIPLKGHLKRFFNTPKALDKDGINTLVNKFALSAKLAKEAGFSGVQIHAAHGYLISQFLSPQHNKRSDEYGGSIDGRMRFLVEIYQAIRKTCGSDFPIAIKLNAKDFVTGGFSEADSMRVIQHLDELGIDLIEISGGTYENPVMSTGINNNDSVYFLEFAEIIRQSFKVPLVITGGFRHLDTMEVALENNATTMIGLARPLALYPDLVNNILDGKIKKVDTKRLKTGIKRLDQRFGPVIGISYYEQQMHRIAKGKAPKIHQNGWRPLLYTIFRHGPVAFKKRRS